MKIVLILLLMAAPVVAEPMLIEDFSEGAETRWRYTSDQVMGGISQGNASLGRGQDTSFARLRGNVSKANNGGFIQIRTDLDTPIATDATGLALRVRGNGATYYVHLRPQQSRRPWQFFQGAFDTTEDWQIVTLPWSAFSAQGGLTGAIAGPQVRSIGIVAYGADYEAVLDVDWIRTTGDD